MDFSRIIFILSLISLFIFDAAEARRSRSKNSIHKRNEKLRRMKAQNNEIKKNRRKHSKNAFRNSNIVKALEMIEAVEERMEEVEEYDEEYYDDAPIINIRFKREAENSLLERIQNSVFNRDHDSILLTKMRLH